MHWRTMVSGAGERLSSTFSSSSTLFVVHTGQLTHLGFSGHQLGCQTAGIACSSLASLNALSLRSKQMALLSFVPKALLSVAMRGRIISLSAVIDIAGIPSGRTPQPSDTNETVVLVSRPAGTLKHCRPLRLPVPDPCLMCTECSFSACHGAEWFPWHAVTQTKSRFPVVT